MKGRPRRPRRERSVPSELPVLTSYYGLMIWTFERSANRNRNSPGNRNNNLGFRPASAGRLGRHVEVHGSRLRPLARPAARS
ncbi:MAG: hypothetical protein JKY65_15995 [Planctomycetes bacterium]|nr:hypothetical protein [Planctomycetota bacterium]